MPLYINGSTPLNVSTLTAAGGVTIAGNMTAANATITSDLTAANATIISGVTAVGATISSDLAVGRMVGTVKVAPNTSDASYYYLQIESEETYKIGLQGRRLDDSSPRPVVLNANGGAVSIGTASFNLVVNNLFRINAVPAYANNELAKTAGLQTGDVYRMMNDPSNNSDPGCLCIVY